MKLLIKTDLSKIAVNFKIQTIDISKYNVVCVLLDKDNKICSSESIVDRRNLSIYDDSIYLKSEYKNEDTFYLNLEKIPQTVNCITFLLIGNPTGDLIENVQSIKATLLDLNKDANIATLKMSVFGRVNKCINICTFTNRKDGWIFREVCKPVRLDDFNLLF